MNIERQTDYPKLFLVQGTSTKKARFILISFKERAWILKEYNGVWVIKASKLDTIRSISQFYCINKNKFCQFRDILGRLYAFDCETEDLELNGRKFGFPTHNYQVLHLEKKLIFNLKFLNFCHYGRFAGLWNSLTIKTNKIFPLFLWVEWFRPYRKISFFRMEKNSRKMKVEISKGYKATEKISKSKRLFFPVYQTSWKGLSHGNIVKVVCK